MKRLKEKIIPFLKKYGAWILLVIVLAFSTCGGREYFDNKRELKKLDSINKVQIATEEELQKKIEEKETYINEILNQKEQTYYDEYIKEKNRRINAEKKLGAIGNLVFNKHYLDSLSEHVTY